MQAQLVESMRREQEQAALAAAYKQQVQQLVRVVNMLPLLKPVTDIAHT